MTAQADDIQWYIFRDGKQHGPLTDVEIRTFAAHDYLRLSDLIWRPGMPEWQGAEVVFPACFESSGREPARNAHKDSRPASAEVAHRSQAHPEKTASSTFPNSAAAPAASGGVFDDIIRRETKDRPTATETAASLSSPFPKAGTADRAQRRLNGPALRGSMFGTWLMLVIGCWAGLIVFFLLSIPFGLGLVGVTQMMMGMVFLPALGTAVAMFWRGGRKSLLREMAFEQVPDDHPLALTTKKLAQDMEIPTPMVGTVGAFNAFAIGRNQKDATVALGRPLLQILTPEELEAVVGHELGHVASGDMARMMMMRNFQNSFVGLVPTQRGRQVFRYLFSLVSELMILRKSRTREFYADAIGAALAGKEAMISVLHKLEGAPPPSWTERTNARFMARGSVTRSWFATHPSFRRRVAALERETYQHRLRWKR
ncbi:MAG: M48 family metalloprotease [Proteobacteria bacterium]|nr:M48 family metalloprotease [Pseudomonadota bacterium]